MQVMWKIFIQAAANFFLSILKIYSLFFFSFFCLFFIVLLDCLLVWCFQKLKIYNLIRIRLCLWVIDPSQYFNVESTLFQRCRSTLKQRWFDVENETKFDVGFSKLHNVDTTSVSDVETMSKQLCTTLHQRCFNVASTLVRSLLYRIELVMIIDL